MRPTRVTPWTTVGARREARLKRCSSSRGQGPARAAGPCATHVDRRQQRGCSARWPMIDLRRTQRGRTGSRRTVRDRPRSGPYRRRIRLQRLRCRPHRRRIRLRLRLHLRPRRPRPRRQPARRCRAVGRTGAGSAGISGRRGSLVGRGFSPPIMALVSLFGSSGDGKADGAPPVVPASSAATSAPASIPSSAPPPQQAGTAEPDHGFSATRRKRTLARLIAARPRAQGSGRRVARRCRLCRRR